MTDNDKRTSLLHFNINYTVKSIIEETAIVFLCQFEQIKFWESIQKIKFGILEQKGMTIRNTQALKTLI